MVNDNRTAKASTNISHSSRYQTTKQSKLVGGGTLNRDSSLAGTHAQRNSVATPLAGERQETDAAEVVAQEYVLLHADKARRWGRA